MDISKAADAVVESEHVGGQLKTPNVRHCVVNVKRVTDCA